MFILQMYNACLEAWQDYLLAQRGLSDKTCEAYACDVRDYLSFMQNMPSGQEKPREPDEEQILLYLTSLRLKNKFSGLNFLVIFPSSFLGWINFFFGVIFAAFFEEVIYRFYLPRAFCEIFGKIKIFRNSDVAQNNQRLSVFCEGLALLLFGLGHIYLGILGFLNALVCGAALRLCMIKTKSLWIPFGIHAVYNFLSFLILFLLF